MQKAKIGVNVPQGRGINMCANLQLSRSKLLQTAAKYVATICMVVINVDVYLLLCITEQ